MRNRGWAGPGGWNDGTAPIGIVVVGTQGFLFRPREFFGYGVGYYVEAVPRPQDRAASK